MGNIRWITAVIAVFFIVFYFFSDNSISQPFQHKIESHNNKPQNNESRPSEIISNNKRSLAQIEENEISTPRKIQIKMINQETQQFPKSKELKEIQISELNDEWKLWPSKKALFPTNLDNINSQFKVGNYEIVESKNHIQSLNEFSVEEPWVLFNERLNTVGVLTGTISIKLNHPDSWIELEKEMNLKLIHSFPEIGLFIATSQSSRFDLEATLKKIKGNSQVENAELEIVSRIYVQ